MAVGNIPTPLVSTIPTVITGALQGNISANQRWMLWSVKNALVAGGWHVVQSYDASGVLPAPGVDSWTDYTKLLGTGGGGVNDSWIVLGNNVNSRQILININVSGGWLEIALAMDPLGAYAGGTTGAAPTSATSIASQLQSASPFGTGPAGNPQFYAVVWVASDLSYTRVAWFYAGKCKQLWQIDELQAVPSGWTNNVLLMCSDWGNTDYTVTGKRMTVTNYATIFGSGGFAKNILTPGPNTVTSAEGVLDASLGGFLTAVNPIANGFSNQYFWTGPLGISKRLGAASVNGAWGFNRDQWWFADIPFNDGDTMGDNRDFIIIGQLALQWDGSVPTLGAASTNYPTARWYGLDGAGTVCNCNPQSCPNATTTPLVNLVNGAKLLSDKVNDASVTQTTWNEWVNDGIESLWAGITTYYQDHFLAQVDFTLAGGIGGNLFDTTTIAAKDFRRARFLERDPDTQQRRRVRGFNLNEKDDGVGASMWNARWAPDIRARLMANKLSVEPYERAGGNYRLYYIPRHPKLIANCDQVDPAIDQWAEYVKVFAAMKALGVEESDDNPQARRLLAIRQEIAETAAQRDDGQADGIADVEDMSTWGWGRL